MVQKSIEEFTGMAEHLLSLNEDVVDPVQINMGISRAIAEGFPLEDMEITAELKIICGSTEREHCIRGVAGVLKVTYDFLQAILDQDSVQEKFIEPLKTQLAENGLEEIIPFLSEIIPLGKEDSPLEGKSDEEKICMIYAACLTPYITSSKKDYTKHMKSMFSSIAKVDTKDGLRFMPKQTDDLAKKMADSFDKFLELFCSLEGIEFNVGAEAIKIREILGRFDPVPRELGITETILFGGLSSTITTGLLSLDALLGGGIPRGESVVLRSTPGWESEIFTRRFIRSSLMSGGSVVLVLSSMSIDDFIAQMESMGLNVERYLEKGSLQIIDWHSHTFRRIIGMEKDGSITTCSHDLTNVNMALEDCLRSQASHPSRTGIVEIASSALMRFGFDTAYEFVQAVNSKFKTANVGGIFVLHKGMHSTEHLHNISGIFSNSVDLEKRTGIEGGDMLISASSVFSVKRKYVTGSWSRRGFILEGEDAEVVPFVYERSTVNLGIPGFEMVGDGIPQGRSVMLLSPECSEKEFIISRFAAKASESVGLLLVLGNMEPEEFSLPRGMKSEETVYVDWFSHKNEKIIGVEKRKNVFRASQDISHLAIAIKQALDEAGDGVFVILDILTPLLRYYDLPVVYSFAVSMSAVLRSRGATVLVPFDGEVFDSEYTAAFMNAFDGVIQLKEGREIGGSKLLWVPSMRNSFSTGRTAVCVFEDDEMRLDGLEKHIDTGKSGPHALKDQSAIMEALLRENVRLKRELFALESVSKDAVEEDRDGGGDSEGGGQEGKHSDVSGLLEEIKNLQEQKKRDMEEVGKVLEIIDELFEKLPEDVLEKFTESEDFSIYERVVDRFALGGSEKKQDTD